MARKADAAMKEAPQREALPEKLKLSRFSFLAIILLLIAAGFGAGALLIQTRLRTAQDAWSREKAILDKTISSQAADLSAAKARVILWGLSDQMSTVLVDLSERNFGLAHDEMTAAMNDLQNTMTGLDAAGKARLDPLLPFMAEIVRDADALSPKAKNETQSVVKLLHDLNQEK